MERPWWIVLALAAAPAGCAGRPVPREVSPARAEPVDVEPRPAEAVDRWGWTVREPELWDLVPIAAAEGAAPWAGGARAEPAPGSREGRQEARVELHVEGRVDELSVAPDGRLWLTTDEGRSYRSDGLGRPFRPGTLAAADRPEGHIDRVTFFTPQKAIATGYIGRGRDEYFLTADGGETWERLRFDTTDRDDGQWIYDAFATPEGEAWMGGSSGRLLHTTDFGRTFTETGAPFDDSSRAHRIFMASSERGVVGALDNAIKATADGGRTWTAVETPLDQGLVVDRDPGTGTDDIIEEVALFGAFLVAAQHGKVCARRAAGGPWRLVGDGDLVAFAADRQGRRLFGVTGDRRVVTVDRRLEARPVAGVRLAREPIHLHVEGDALYVLDDALRISRITASGVDVAPPTSEASELRDLRVARRHGELLFGISSHHLYGSSDGGRRWVRLADSATLLVGLAGQGPETLLLWGEGGAAAFDIPTGGLEPIPSLSAGSIAVISTDGGPWLAWGGSAGQGEVFLSGDRGESWRLALAWPGHEVRQALRLPGGALLAWSWRQAFRRVELAGGAARVVDLTGPNEAEGRIGFEFPCCTSLYFADDRTGFLSGYVHHGGDRAYRTGDGGETWQPVDREGFPYVRVVPHRRGALAVRGRSFSTADGDRRELFLLEGRGRRLVLAAEQAISDVSVDREGRVLVELDAEPGSLDDSAGRSWLELRE